VTSGVVPLGGEKSALTGGLYAGSVSPYVRTIKTKSGGRAVRIVYSSHGGSLELEHIGSAHDDAALEALKAVARQRLARGQGELDLGLDDAPPAGGPLPITSTRSAAL